MNSRHPLILEWLSHPVTKLLIKSLDNHRKEFVEFLIYSDGFDSSAKTGHLCKLVGKIHLIDQIKQLELDDGIFSDDDVLELGDEEC